MFTIGTQTTQWHLHQAQNNSISCAYSQYRTLLRLRARFRAKELNTEHMLQTCRGMAVPQSWRQIVLVLCAIMNDAEINLPILA